MDIQITSLKSSFDGIEQPVKYFCAPGSSRPLLVALHSWGGDYTQEFFCDYYTRCKEHEWNLIHPDFRGPNRRPETCGSEAAMNDILDAVRWAQDFFVSDPRRIFLVGVSGGGHMALQVAGHFPSLWTAVSAWVPISDLAKWYRETSVREMHHYVSDMEAICSGAPGSSEVVDREYRQRSPISSLWRAHIVPLDINAGIHDGHGGTFGGVGSIPVGQSIMAFNEIAKATENYQDIIGNDAIEFIEQTETIPSWCDRGYVYDSGYPRKIHLRRTSSLARLTLFEGGHEILYDAAFAWFDKF